MYIHKINKYKMRVDDLGLHFDPCLTVISKTCLERSGPPCSAPSRPSFSHCFVFQRVWQRSRTSVPGARARLAAGSRAPVRERFIFRRLSGNAFRNLSRALGPALRRALAPKLVSASSSNAGWLAS